MGRWANYENVAIPTNLEVKNEVRERFGQFYASLFDHTLANNPNPHEGLGKGKDKGKGGGPGTSEGACAHCSTDADTQRYGGWLHQRIDNQVVLRIPAEKLELAMATVAELGVVDYRLLEALDVTAEYTDLESRMRVLAEMQKHLQALLAKAVSVEQALEIRRALDSVTLELEAARAQMRELAKSIAFSTLILRLVERGPTQELPSTNDPFPWVDELGAEATEFR